MVRVRDKEKIGEEKIVPLPPQQKVGEGIIVPLPPQWERLGEGPRSIDDQIVEVAAGGALTSVLSHRDGRGSKRPRSSNSNIVEAEAGVPSPRLKIVPARRPSCCLRDYGD